MSADDSQHQIKKSNIAYRQPGEIGKRYSMFGVIENKVKKKVYKTIVRPGLMYGITDEMWMNKIVEDKRRHDKH